MSKNKRSVAKKAEEILSKQQHHHHDPIHFSKAEIEMLIIMYNSYVTAPKRMDRSTFRDILQSRFGMTDDLMMDKDFKAFDKDNDGYISVDEWVSGLSVFLRGWPEEKKKFVFRVYCTRHEDTHLKRDELFQMLKDCIQKPNHDEDPDEGPKELVELLLKKMDRDHDSYISIDDYMETVKEEPLLLQALGRCLPTDEQIEEFEACLCPSYAH